MAWLAIIVADVVCLVFIIVAFVIAFRQLRHQNVLTDSAQNLNDKGNSPSSFIAWLVYSIVICVKAGVLFKDVSYLLDESVFFGPNTLKRH